ncbi:MAG: hypothetical protein RR324_00420 [Cellulosilyticaceae bacterium]
MKDENIDLKVQKYELLIRHKEKDLRISRKLLLSWPRKISSDDL